MILTVIFMETTWSVIRCCHVKAANSQSTAWYWERLNEVVAYLRNLPSAAVDYFSEVFKLVKFNTSCCTCHECCEWVLGLCSWKAQDQYLWTTMSQKKIESLHDYPRSPANDWLIEHGRHWKSVCLNIKNNRQNRFLNGSINKLTIDNFLQKSSSLILYTGKFFFAKLEKVIKF